MPIKSSDILFIYSGGASNTSQDSSLGGAISTAVGKKVVSQTFTLPDLVTGVTILDAMGNPEGNGTLKWDSVSGGLTWRPFGALTYKGLLISKDGVYVLGDGAGYLVVEVDYSALPAFSTQDNDITIANAVNKTFDNITTLDSLEGRVNYRCFYVLNNSSSSIAVAVVIWIKRDLQGPDVMSLCLDPGGKNVSALGPLISEEDPEEILSGLTFTKPLTQATGLVIGDLSPGDFYPFWIKRVIAPENVVQLVRDTSTISVSTWS